MRQQDQNLFHVLETREALELTMVARAAQRRELPELFQLRQILEGMAAIPLTVESPEYAELDVEFHLEIGRLSGNTVMTSLLRDSSAGSQAPSGPDPLVGQSPGGSE